MTDSMIPYSFIPGTKAKADEVNANFIALANFINQTKQLVNNDIGDVYDALTLKADKTELNTVHTVVDAQTDLNNYKISGTYIFSSLCTPNNIPKDQAGMLIVTGDETSVIKQIWFCTDTNPEVFTRQFENSSWSAWKSMCGLISIANSGYIKLQNGLLIQWGYAAGSVVTFPIAYSVVACPVFAKHGYNEARTKCDTGYVSQSLTGFSMGTMGAFSALNWIAIGY